jgi:hypothetical protein
MRTMSTTVQLIATPLTTTYTAGSATPEKFKVVFTPSVTGGVAPNTAVSISPEALLSPTAATDTALVSTADAPLFSPKLCTCTSFCVAHVDTAAVMG